MWPLGFNSKTQKKMKRFIDNQIWIKHLALFPISFLKWTLTIHCPWTQGLLDWQMLEIWEQPVGPYPFPVYPAGQVHEGKFEPNWCKRIRWGRRVRIRIQVYHYYHVSQKENKSLHTSSGSINTKTKDRTFWINESANSQLICFCTLQYKDVWVRQKEKRGRNRKWSLEL